MEEDDYLIYAESFDEDDMPEGFYCYIGKKLEIGIVDDFGTQPLRVI